MTKKPATSFDLIHEWFMKARDTARGQGRLESAMLWSDGLDHLLHLKSENDRLRELLKELVRWSGDFGGASHAQDGILISKAKQKAIENARKVLK